MNDLTSPELISKVNPDNIRLKNDYVEYLRSTQKSPGTIRGYSNDIDIFFVYCLIHLNNKFFADISKRDLVSFQNWLLNENGNSPARVRRLKATLSSLSNFVEAILDEEPEFQGFRSIIRKVESPVNQPVRDKSVFSDEQLAELLDELTADEEYEKACALALAMYSGRRKSELVRFKVSDFRDENLVCSGALYRTTDPVKTKGFGMGKYMRCYTLAKGFRPYYDRWIKYREENGIDSEWLFPNRDDMSKQRSADTLNNWANSFTRRMGVDFYWHAMRHYFTTNLSRQGLPDGVIQEIVGWASSDMVRVYKDLSTEEQLDQYFDENGIKSTQPTKLSDL